MKAIVGSLTQDEYGVLGIITRNFDSWEDLKDKCDFVTLVNERDSEDSRDEWLNRQNTPITNKEIKMNWATVKHFSVDERCLLLGCSWSPINRISVVLGVSNN